MNKNSKKQQKNKTYGSRAEVYHGTAEKTTGGLKKEDLVIRDGRIKSKKKSSFMLKNPDKNPLKKYLRPKGSKEFGAVLHEKDANEAKGKGKVKGKSKSNKKSESVKLFGFTIF